MKLHVDVGVLESPIVSASKYVAYTQTPNKDEERRKMVQTITDRDFPQTGQRPYNLGLDSRSKKKSPQSKSFREVS